jgi:hypothetical protein
LAAVLLHDARLAARRLGAAGVAVQLRVWPGQMHVFQIAAPIVPEADQSLRQIGNYIREATERKATPPAVQGYHRGSRRAAISDSASNRSPSSTIHLRTGAC